MNDTAIRVAYILSLKGGIPAWNYREIDILTRNGVDIWAYPTKWTAGSYEPKAEWHFRRPSVGRTLASQPRAILANPRRYVKLFALARKMRTVPEFLIAMDNVLDMRGRGIQHIHCHFGDLKFFIGYYCSRMLDLPLTVTVHAYEILMNPNPGMFKLAASECKAIVVQSEFNKREVMREFGVPEEKFRIIRAHGDMSDERTRTSVKALIVAEFREKKGHEVLFRALKKLGRDDITLWVVGEGILDVRQMAADIGVLHLVTFLGRQKKDVINILYDACDFLVQPSRTTADGDREGIPAVIMEAMSHHKPVISTRHTGIPEVVSEILVDENDVDGLAEAIARLADNPEVRTELGDRNYELIKREFSDDAVLQLKRLYEGATVDEPRQAEGKQ